MQIDFIALVAKRKGKRNISKDMAEKGVKETKRTLIGMSLTELAALASSLGMPSYTGKQLANRIYRKGTASFSDMIDISKDNRALLADRCRTGFMPPLKAEVSEDGTKKYLFPTSTGHPVETVFIPEGGRATLCVSCQAGCKMNCAFCQTGKQGFEGNLTAGDILNQYFSLPEKERITNIVFMGQGEPLDNLDSVLRAAELLQAPYSAAWSPKRITVSTVGIRGKLKRFIEESACHLAVSLHFARPEQRAEMMPAEKGMPIREIVALLKRYDWSHQRRLTFEYTAFDRLNDSLEDARRVASLLQGLDCRVNIIRFHESDNVALRASSERNMTMMADYLNSRGIVSTIRVSRGKDIKAACGLLSTAAKHI